MIFTIETTDMDLCNSITGFKLNPRDRYYLILVNGNIAGVYQVQEITNILCLLHMHITEKYRNQDIARQSFKDLIDNHLKDLGYMNLLGTVSQSNEHMKHVAEKAGATCQGIVLDGIKENNEIQNLLIYQYKITGNQ